MELPGSRGPLSSAVIALLRGGRPPILQRPADLDPVADDDLHLALYLCYELHYGGIDRVDPQFEWDPSVLGVRARLERWFEEGLRSEVSVASTAERIDEELRRLIASDRSPSVSSYLARSGTEGAYREFLMHRSAYHLKEADPHTFAIPRLRGRAKAAIVEIQADEYGGGDATWMHSALFARSMRALGLDAREGAYVERLPGVTLATVNLMSLFGLHRRLRGSAVGHLAVFEMTSCTPNRRYGDGLRRLGFDRNATAYFDEHVEADAAHGAIAATDLAGSLVADEPELRDDVVFGAAALLALDGRWAERVLGAWGSGRSSLLGRRSAVITA